MKQLSTIYIAILVLFHIIGTYLFLNQPAAVELSWFNLLLCGVLLLISEKRAIRTIFVFTTIWFGGILVEYIGVHTGLLFGEYNYGSALGLKVFGIPLIIGVNWYAIVLSSANLVKKLKFSIHFKAILTGLLCTLMDYVIEPVAIRFDFWSWNGDIPFYNYICWFIFSTLFAYVYLHRNNSINKPAVALYPIWLTFFILLNLL